jgi:hypothetical protein
MIPQQWNNLSQDEITIKFEEMAMKVSQMEDDEFEKFTQENGFKDPADWDHSKQEFYMSVAAKEGISYTQAVMNGTMIYQQHSVKANSATMGQAGGIMSPVEGVSLEQWAQVNAKIVSGGNVDDLIKTISCDKAKWDRVNNEWNTRMSNDTTFTIATVYGQAFTAPAAGAAPVDYEAICPYEKYMEVSVAMDIFTQQGHDPQKIISNFGFTLSEWTNIGAFWSKRFMEQTDKYYELHNKYDAEFRQKYSAGAANSDLEL